MSVYARNNKDVGKTSLDDAPKAGGDDDWETDPDYVNDVGGTKASRFGSKLVQPEKNAVDLGKLRQEVQQDDAKSKAGQKHSSQVHKYGEQ